MRQPIVITFLLFAGLACSIAHAAPSHAAGQRAGIQVSATELCARGDSVIARGPTGLGIVRDHAG